MKTKQIILLALILVVSTVMLADVNFFEGGFSILKQLNENMRAGNQSYASASRSTDSMKITEILTQKADLEKDDELKANNLTTYDYDDNGLLIRATRKWFDGKTDEWSNEYWIVDITRNEEGLITNTYSYTVDSDGRENPGISASQEYNDEGHAVFFIIKYYDNNYWRNFIEGSLKYNSKNQCTRFDLIEFKDSFEQGIVSYLYSYTEEGKVDHTLMATGYDYEILYETGYTTKTVYTYINEDTSSYECVQNYFDSYMLNITIPYHGFANWYKPAPLYKYNAVYNIYGDQNQYISSESFDYTDQKLTYINYDSAGASVVKRDFYVYNNEGMITEIQKQVYDNDLQEWRTYLRNVATYDEYSSADEFTAMPAKASAKNYPNPFNPETIISFNLPQDQFVEVAVYNSKGQLVDTIINENRSSGLNSVVWNGTDSNNRSMPSGLYFYRISGKTLTLKGKMLMLK
ncbi:MAG: FlgD immunoglobulin-like domain containing protein [Candidatus Cloacimonas sp.]|nr:T9SS type A sorting domain-containing protein [Candidatus Cloacimonadota bacterium]